MFHNVYCIPRMTYPRNAVISCSQVGIVHLDYVSIVLSIDLDEYPQITL